MSFRQVFKLASKKPIHWFPGHMGKGIKHIQQKVRTVDCLIEVHDARIPYSGRNPELSDNIIGAGIKPHIVVFNKKDLIEVREQKRLEKEVRERQGVQNIVFTNCKDQQCWGIRRLLPMAHELISNADRYNRTGEKDFCIMIMGVPNVGKSSLINILRNKNLHKKSAAQVGGIPGITKSVMEKIKISEKPLMYMVDTPGILVPKIANDEMGMKLALVGCLPDHLVGEDLIADYLLYWLNRQELFAYVTAMGLRHPTDNVMELLVAGAHRMGVKKKLKQFDGQICMVPDILSAAKQFITLFRRGNLGLINLDKEFPKKSI